MTFSSRTFIVFICLTLFTCKKDPVLSTESNNLVNDEIMQESILSEIDGLIWYAFENNPLLSADGIPIHKDNRLSCTDTKITYANITEDQSAGNITIDFGTGGCMDKRGNTRKGKIEISWTDGKWFEVGSIQSIQLNDFSINNILVNGTKNHTCTGSILFKNQFAITWHITANHTLTWPDMSVDGRTVSEYMVWQRNRAQNTFTYGNYSDHSATGINRHNQKYTISLELFVYSDSCTNAHKAYLPIIGSKKIIEETTSKIIQIDVNTGYCSNLFYISADGLRKTLEVNDNFKFD